MLDNKTILSSKIENVWEARISPDDRNSQHYGYYDSYDKARESVKGKSWYGSDGRVDTCSQLALTINFADGTIKSFILSSGFEIQRETAQEKAKRLEEARKTALAKLTESEREALGL